MSKILGLVGPSGVGKGFAKEAIRSYYGDTIAEPTVITTRAKRSADGLDRIAGIPLPTFIEMAKTDKIIFPHQPFGKSGDWYGFLKESFQNNKPLLTEVHVDNVIPFCEFFSTRLALIGLKATRGYLGFNLSNRATENIINQQKRLDAALAEIEKIDRFFAQGLIHSLIEINFDNRNIFQDLIVTQAVALLSI